jgi:hypothetical protein
MNTVNVIELIIGIVVLAGAVVFAVWYTLRRPPRGPAATIRARIRTRGASARQ